MWSLTFALACPGVMCQMALPFGPLPPFTPAHPTFQANPLAYGARPSAPQDWNLMRQNMWSALGSDAIFLSNVGHKAMATANKAAGGWASGAKDSVVGSLERLMDSLGIQLLYGNWSFPAEPVQLANAEKRPASGKEAEAKNIEANKDKKPQDPTIRIKNSRSPALVAIATFLALVIYFYIMSLTWALWYGQPNQVPTLAQTTFDYKANYNRMMKGRVPFTQLQHVYPENYPYWVPPDEWDGPTSKTEQKRMFDLKYGSNLDEGQPSEGKDGDKANQESTMDAMELAKNYASKMQNIIAHQEKAFVQGNGQLPDHIKEWKPYQDSSPEERQAYHKWRDRIK